ncbi:hypothetical protein EMCRGX_G017457 [Ephydatia muelleri]
MHRQGRLSRTRKYEYVNVKCSALTVSVGTDCRLGEGKSGQPEAAAEPNVYCRDTCSLNDDLVQIMKDNAEAVCTAHPPGTFGRVFLGNTVEAASVKNARQMWWDPIMRKTSVIFDEMHIREDLTYDKHTGCLTGFVDIGDINCHLADYERQLSNHNIRDPLASSMLVLMEVHCKAEDSVPLREGSPGYALKEM